MTKVAFPYGICALLLLPSLYWIARDKAVWLWDQAWYGEVSVDLWYLLVHHRKEWIATLIQAFSIKAPGIAWVGEFFVPLGQAFGSIEVGLLLSVLAAQFATLVLMYKLGSELGFGGKPAALLGVLFVAAGPLFVAMAHQYMVESLQVLAVTYIFWIATAAPRLSRLRLIAHLLLASALALSAKSTSPLYCIFPGLVAGFWVVRAKCWMKDRSEGLRSLGILTIGIVAATATTAWYSHNLAAVAEFVKNASGGAFSLYYGHVGTFGAKLMFWLRALRVAFFIPIAPIAIGLLALTGFVLFRKRGVARGLRRSHLVVAAALAEVLLVLAVFSFQVSEETRYLLPMVPALAICLVWVLSLGGATVLRAAACLMAVQLIVVHSHALGLTDINWNVSPWLVPYQRDLAAPAELRELVRLTSEPGTEFRFNIVGAQFPWLNENALSFYAAQGRLLTGRRNYFTSLGYAETDADKAWNRMEQFKTLYFVGAEADRQPIPPDFLNQVSVPILKRVMADPNYASVPFPSRSGILLFRRVDAPAR
jgi:4-amino-4-deoxy-L-arabinose transferase-like glycosyltransferase